MPLAPSLTHMGIFVFDLARMEAFYTKVLGLTPTDRGRGIKFPVEYVFLSADPTKHHQFVLCTGRPPEATFSTVFQISFRVDTVADLRAMHARAQALDLANIRPINHGNALSVYFDDPEGNTIEIYMDTAHYVSQPHYHPLDFAMSDAEILADTDVHARADPTHAEREDWIAAMAVKMGRTI